VEYATRLSNSGIFIHQATPSAMPYLGARNLSHGCIGLSPEGASWVFANMGAGDLVNTVGTPNATIAPTDGFGDWNIPFAQYASR
jgi:lipoprotein-anchoring transpeptidase ErfK/SrfK